MQKGALQYEDLKGFERLDPGELYFLTSRQAVERGMVYYRNYNVESLEWDSKNRAIVAGVSGGRSEPYEVRLQLRGGKISHDCDCAEWTDSAACKHVVAATAAAFLAIQGKSTADYEMPADYAQELRMGLGYRDVGGVLDAEDSLEAFDGEEDAALKSELLLTKIEDFGVMQFQVLGEVPHAFLRSMGISMSNAFYGFSNSREFLLAEPESEWIPFLEQARTKGISVCCEIDGAHVELRMANLKCCRRVVYEWSAGQVYHRNQYLGADGDLLDAYQGIEGTRFVILRDGRVLTCENEPKETQVGLGLAWTPTKKDLNIAASQFNEEEPLLCDSTALRPKGQTQFWIDGAERPPEEEAEETSVLQLRLQGMVNAADELEGMRYELCIRNSDTSVKLDEIGGGLFEPLLETSGPLLGAKYRVRALFDLVRRMLSNDPTDSSPLSKQSLPKEDFPDLLNQRHGYEVESIVHSVLLRVDGARGRSHCMALDFEKRQWLAFPLDIRKIAMLLYSLIDASSREDVAQLHAGVGAVPRGQDSGTALQRIMAVCRALGVEMVFNEGTVRSEKVSVDFQGMEGASGIDWFELHPSIRCGDRKLSAKEWRQLVQGKLMLKGADGNWVMPEFDEVDTDGVRMLASWLEREVRRKNGAGGADDRFQVSRLEMLDWIALRKRGMKLTLPDEAERVFESLMRFDSIGKFPMPKGFNAELRVYQNEGCAWIDFLYQHRFGACLADDMGLGKTVQTIGFLVKHLNERKSTGTASVLIVLPPSLVFNWLDEWTRFAPGVRVGEAMSSRTFAADLKKADVLLTTYDRVRMDADVFKQHAFDIVVFDEAHNLKNVSAARTKSAAKLRRRFTLCLTGTPVENNVSEFFSVLSMAVPGIFGNLKDFKEAFREDPDRLLARARPFILRRKKEKILKELPPKEEHELFLEMAPLQKEIYTRTVAEVKAEIAEAYEGRPEQQAGIVALAAILRLRQVCVSPEILGKPLKEPAPKFAYMAEKLEELRSEGHAALVFSQFHGGLNEMEKIAATCGFDYLRMDGKTPVSKRKQIVADFQAGDGPPFFFISLKTGGVGLNLTRANYVFHLDPWWNPAVENQASDRAHRIGQTRSVFVQRLIMRHTIEERMLDLKARKAKLFRQLIDDPGGKSSGAGLNKNDFDFLING